MGITYSLSLYPVKPCTMGRYLRDVSKTLAQRILTSLKLTLLRRNFHFSGTPKEAIGSQVCGVAILSLCRSNLNLTRPTYTQDENGSIVRYLCLSSMLVPTPSNQVTISLSRSLQSIPMSFRQCISISSLLMDFTALMMVNLG